MDGWLVGCTGCTGCTGGSQIRAAFALCVCVIIVTTIIAVFVVVVVVVVGAALMICWQLGSGRTPCYMTAVCCGWRSSRWLRAEFCFGSSRHHPFPCVWCIVFLRRQKRAGAGNVGAKGRRLGGMIQTVSLRCCAVRLPTLPLLWMMMSPPLTRRTQQSLNSM